MAGAAYACAALLLLLAAAARANVTVVRLQLPFESERELLINNSVEYIVEFVPTGEEGAWPARVWAHSDGGDAAHPLLLTARQRTGAQTWQLPYARGELLLRELERTLCRDDGSDDVDSECAPEQAAVRGQFSLHLASACAADMRVRVRASPARDWQLPFDLPTEVLTTQAAPRVLHYRFEPQQSSVRLVVASEDSVCATISVQNYSCPVPETRAEVEVQGVRMTVQRSGAVQLSSAQYPRGFLVVALVHDTDEECDGAAPAEPGWLWEVVLAIAEPAAQEPPPPRRKLLELTVRPALSRAQYALAAVITAALFLLFYVAFGGVVLAQRFPCGVKLMGPRAVLAGAAPVSPPPTNADGGVGATTAVDGAGAEEQAEPAHRRRRGSDATFDSSDDSASDDDEPATDASAVSAAASRAAQGNGAVPATTADTALASDGAAVDGAAPAAASASSERPFGLPERLHLAALARRRARTLRARSDRYLYTLLTVAVFYALPVVQFVAAFQVMLNVSGTLDLCYYNFLCAHPAGALSDFNHVFSNLGYLLLGALFLLQLRRRRRRRARAPKHEEYGIPPHYGLLASLGAGMMVVALLSASYHVCPNQLNFQFDTAFMYVLAVLSMVKIYQARHPDVNARAHATFGVLAVLIALVVWGVLGGGALFWSLFTVLHVFTFLLLSLRIYYVGQFRLDKQWLTETTRGIRELPRRGARPLYTARLVLLLIANAVNWAFALYGLFTMAADFASHLLQLLLGNTLMYMLFYLAMKLLHGERLRWYAWCLLAGAAAAWAPALYFFVYGSSDWAATPAHSRHRNHECKVLQFYDSHDLWHLLSAVALYLSFNAMLTWDDGLSAVPRTQIAVF